MAGPVAIVRAKDLYEGNDHRLPDDELAMRQVVTPVCSLDEQGIAHDHIIIAGIDALGNRVPCRVDATGRLDVVGVCPELQVDAVLAQANPVSGTRYEVLPETELVRIYMMNIECTWTVQPSPLELWIEIDGIQLMHRFGNPVSDAHYYTGFAAYDPQIQQPLTTIRDEQRRQAFIYEGRTVRVEAEITGGTVSLLDCRVKWARW